MTTAPRLNASELFIFAGAGLSASPPSSLPMFNRMRDHILDELGLGHLLSERGEDSVSPVRTLTPEPFFAALEAGHLDIESFLQGALDVGRPNAGHATIAQLALTGAKVWTVNYDELIERAAGGRLTWYARGKDESGPIPDRHVMKPHGTLSEHFKVYTTQQVATGLPKEWRKRLAADVRDRVVVFVGSSGRDLDFLAVWPQVLEGARQILWFSTTPVDRDERDARSSVQVSLVALAPRLVFVEEPPLAKGGNPTRRFIEWCVEMQLIDQVDPALLLLLSRPPQPAPLPPLRGPRIRARSDILGKIGRYAQEELELAHQCLVGPDRVDSLLTLAKERIHHSGPRVNVVLTPLSSAPARLLSPRLAEHARRWRLEKLSGAGRVDQVMRALEHREPGTANDVCYLTMATRSVGDLDQAVEVVTQGQRQFSQCNPFLLANMSFQRALTLVWAGRYEEARRELDERTRPAAQVTAVRWVAWERFARAVLNINSGDPSSTVEDLRFARQLFDWEGHRTASLYCLIAELTAIRQRGEARAWEHTLEMTRRTTQRRSSRGRPAQDQLAALLVERGQFAHFHEKDPQRAAVLYEAACASWPIIQAQATFLWATLEPDSSERLDEARRIAERINCRPLLSQIDEFISTGHAKEVFFA